MYRGFESYFLRMEVDIKEENEKFFYSVIKDLNHRDWKLEWYGENSCEGYCWLNRKIINIGPESENVKRLILHEIAHIDTCLDENNKHELEFWKRYEELLNKYLSNASLSESEIYTKELYVKNEN